MTKGILIRGIAVAVAAFICAVGSAYGLFIHRFYPDPPSNAFPRPGNPLQAQRQDLMYFRSLLAMDRSFSPAGRKDAEAAITALESRDAPLSRQELHVKLMQIMALADNGHSQVSIVPANGDIDVLPVRVTVFADGMYVMRARDGYGELLGGRVEAVDNVPIDTVIRQLETLRGGLRPFRRDKAALYLPIQDLLTGFRISPDAGKSRWTVRMPSGQTLTRTLVSERLPKGDFLPDAARWMSSEPSQSLVGKWSALRPSMGDGTAPLPLQRFDDLFVRAPVEGSCATYVRMRSIADDDGQQIQPFIAATEEALRANPPCAVILDLRYSNGGDFTKSYAFGHELPKLVAPTGHLYILTDALTFSAAITTAGFVKEAGGNAVTILGEPLGDRLAFFAEGGRGCLPNSGLCVDYATGKHDYAQPCRDWTVCFWLTWLYPVRVQTLAPDELIPVRFSDWDSGRDVAFDRAAQLANQLPRP